MGGDIKGDFLGANKVAEKLRDQRQGDSLLAQYPCFGYCPRYCKKKEEELERKNKELRKINKLMVGREERMVELKEKIKQLEG